MTINASTDQLWAQLFRAEESKKAAGELERRAYQGDRDAQWFLAQWLTWDERLGFGKMSGAALGWLKKAAASGHADALLELGHLTIRRSVPRAMTMFEQSAELGNPLAHWALGEALEEGDQSSVRRARRHYTACCSKLPACNWKLGELSLFGIGAKVDVPLAIRLFRTAARTHESPEAETYLGFLSETGTGVQKSRGRAAKWYRRAARNPFAAGEGDPIAQARLAALLEAEVDASERQACATQAAEAGLPYGMVLLAREVHLTSPSRARSLLKSAIRADKSWRSRFGHWRCIQDAHQSAIGAARQVLAKDKGVA